jgi:hypothetical protein
LSDVFTLPMRDARTYLRDAAIGAAHELRLFEALPSPADEIACRLGVSAHRLRALVCVLLRDGALAVEDGQLHRANLSPRRALPYEGWGRLADVIRTDRPIPSDGIEGVAGEELRRFHDHLRGASAEAARELAGRLGPRGPLLDLGSGAGTYAAAFLERNPGERAILVDRPAVLDLAFDVAPGAERVPLDLLGSGPWPGGARVALLANVLHLFSATDAAVLVGRAAHAVEPGGTVVVKDLDAASEAGIFFSLNMALFTQEGEVHATEALRSFFAAARLRDVHLERLRCAPDAILLRGTAA